MTMTRSLRQLARKQLDQRFATLRALPFISHVPPRGGWIRAIREALGMPRRALGSRIGVSEKRVIQLERGEAEGKLTMESLKRAAEALDCELIVALVPRRSLEQTIDEKRMQLASSWLQSRALHTMALEGQAVSLGDLPIQTVRDVELRFPDERLWD